MTVMTLNGIKAIAQFLGCERARVRSLVRQGAPIRVTGDGEGKRYLADSEALRAWLAPPPATSAT